MSDFILAIDQGTTSSRAILFAPDRVVDGGVLATAQRPCAQSFPHDGWVEQDPEDLWQGVVEACHEVLASAPGGAAPLAIGITNQRETCVLWERATGRALYPAIVWQDRRTAEFCGQLRDTGREAVLVERTGLLADPYFSATKLRWMLEEIPGARERARAGELAFGTMDSWLIWRLTEGVVHATDATNASRTQLFNLHTQDWDDELLDIFDLPRALLPRVCDCADDFGTTRLFGAPVPIRGVAGDQQAALIGQGCLAPGMVKATYGTGCFVLLNTGDTLLRSANRLLGTLAYRFSGRPTYALEGSVFIAGAAVQWLRDGLGLFANAADTEAIAAAGDGSAGVYLVPAFTGLGAPYWDAGARGALLGLTRDTGITEVVTAGLESVCLQTRDLLEAMAGDGCAPRTLRVDGGMVVNSWLVQRLADVLGIPVQRPEVVETTVLGAACLAGLGAGCWKSPAALAERWRCERTFEPAPGREPFDDLYAGWRRAVARVRSD